MRYDPSKYETVEARLKRLHATNPNVTVHTDIHWHSDDFTMVCFKAELHENGDVISTGFAMDWKQKDRGATTTNWVETSETSAIGRAIANSKYQDKDAQRHSLEEMEIAATRNESGQANQVTQAKPADSPAKKTKAQLLEEVVGDNEKSVNEFLLSRKEIKSDQTYRDVKDSYAKSIIQYPAKFLALAVAHSAKS